MTLRDRIGQRLCLLVERDDTIQELLRQAPPVPGIEDPGSYLFAEACQHLATSISTKLKPREEVQTGGAYL